VQKFAQIGEKVFCSRKNQFGAAKIIFAGKIDPC
jgi:hypothetical protein